MFCYFFLIFSFFFAETAVSTLWILLEQKFSGQLCTSLLRIRKATAVPDNPVAPKDFY